MVDGANMSQDILKVAGRGAEILSCSLLNKGTAFSQEERDQLGLNGLLPPQISSIEQQIERIWVNFSQKRSPIEKYECLIRLMTRNELLFYQFIARYPVEVLPIIYTPTVGDAAMQYSRIYFHQRGLYLSYPHMDKIEEAFLNYRLDDVEVVVVTDGERILGLGDLGIGGMTIPIGKLSLYTLFAGIHPAKTLPIILDVGTNNQELLKDELYLGWRHNRIQGVEYDKFIEKFVKALKKRYPNVLLQWEDFGRNNARRLLDHYREKTLSFNDDIQGTAAVTLAALLTASKVAGESLRNAKVAILGGGSAGTGIADMIVNAMVEEGLSLDEARSRIYIVDIEGLIHFGTREIHEPQKIYVQSQENLKNWKIHTSQITLFDVIANAKPNILIGVSAQGGAFNRDVILEMSRHTKRPIIFPLSNPTTKAECTPDEAIEWTDGRAILATGSPFPPVIYNGKMVHITQCNNVYIFPGLGLGALVSKANRVTDGMLLAAARELASHAPAFTDPEGTLFPRIEDVRAVSKKIAFAVAQKACAEGVGSCPKDLEKEIESKIWTPHYPKYVPI